MAFFRCSTLYSSDGIVFRFITDLIAGNIAFQSNCRLYCLGRSWLISMLIYVLIYFRMTELAEKLDFAFQQLSQMKDERTRQDEIVSDTTLMKSYAARDHLVKLRF